MAITAIALVLVLFLFLGNAASSAFASLGVVAGGFWFLRERCKRTIVDERDCEIEKQVN